MTPTLQQAALAYPLLRLTRELAQCSAELRALVLLGLSGAQATTLAGERARLRLTEAASAAVRIRRLALVSTPTPPETNQEGNAP